MKHFKIKLDTGNRFWTPKGLGAMGMDPHRAVAELVANSLDWRRKIEDKIDAVVQIKIGKNSIEVIDNGVGMSIEELQDAIQLSVSEDTRRKNLRIRKGMFGMGMKVACLTLGWKLTIYTRSINEKNQEHYVQIDTKKLDNNQTGENDKEFQGDTTKHKANSPLNGWQSGTAIRIENLIFKNISPVALRDSIQEIFSPEITTEEVKITVEDLIGKNVYECKKVSPSVFPESVIILDELGLFIKDEDTGKNVQIRGWLGLLKTAGSGTGKWGLHLFKNNQIIERFHQLPIRLGGLMPKNPHPVYARTYGEIHLDMCRPAFHKVGFDYSTNNWKQAQELLFEHIQVVMEASNNYRTNDYQKAQKSLKSIQRHKKVSKKAVSNLKSAKENAQIPENAIILPNGSWFTIVEPIFEDLFDDAIDKPWIYHYSSKSKELAIVVNKRSAVYNTFIEKGFDETVLELIVNWAITDSLMHFVYDKFDFELNEAISFKNKILQSLFLKPEEVGYAG